MDIDIAEVARRAGVAASALRYYEKMGLITSLGAEGTRRRFAPAVLNQLALIALGQAAGLSLDEIKAMLSPHGGPKIDRPLLAAKADEIDATIRHLRAVSRGLRHAAACPARSRPLAIDGEVQPVAPLGPAAVVDGDIVVAEQHQHEGELGGRDA